MRRLFRIILGLVIIAAIAMAFGWTFTWWFGLAPARALEVLLLFAAAMVIVSGLFIAGELIPFRGHAYYVIAGGAVFLATDVVIWWRFGIMPGPKFFQDGFVPAAIMGIFLGPIYRGVAMQKPALPRDPKA